MAHGARKRVWLEWILRMIIAGTFAFQGLTALGSGRENPWVSGVMVCMSVGTGLILFKVFRQILSYILSAFELLLSGQVFVALFRKSPAVVPFVPSNYFFDSSSADVVPTPVSGPLRSESQSAVFSKEVGAAKEEESPKEALIEEPDQREPAEEGAAKTATEASEMMINAEESAEGAAAKEAGGDESAGAAAKEAGGEESAGAAAKEEDDPAQEARPEAASFGGAVENAPQRSVVVVNNTPIGRLVQAFYANKVLVPTSIPHMVALFIYICTAAYLLGGIDPEGMQMPGLPLPIPVQLDQLFSYNGLGLVMLALCGVGIFVSRGFGECMKRLGIVVPTLAEVGVGFLIVLGSFGYEYLWSLFTHQIPELANKLAMYNAGTFSVAGGLAASIILALATAIFAGVGEETLIRGALQPALGILPAAILHGILHGQFNHAPILMIQVTIWSILMGLIRRYTNTTATIMGHAGFNFVTTFLFAFNP